MDDPQRAVFRDIAQARDTEWPASDSTPLYNRGSLDALQEDIRTVGQRWFKHTHHESVEEFVCQCPLAYFGFNTHDRYAGSTRYDMETLFRVVVLKELHGWEHETALVDDRTHRSDFCEQLDFETSPDQSTLWRSWNERFTADLRETVETAARTILINAQNAGVGVPREPTRELRDHRRESGEPEPDDQTPLEQTEKITDHVSRIVSPTFSGHHRSDRR